MLSKILTILRKISKIIAENDDQALVLEEIVKVCPPDEGIVHSSL